MRRPYPTSSFPWGDGLSPGEREALAALEPHLLPRRYPAGQVLWTEGESSGRLTVLDRGRVKILRGLPDGRPVLLYVFGPGEVFGFLPFLDGGPYPATAVALDEVEARVLSRTRLRELVEREPAIALLLLAALGKRLRDAFQRVEELSRRDASGRVAAGLVTLLPEGASAAEGAIVELPEAAARFSEELGLTAETFSRTAGRLVREGVLHRLGPGRWQVLDPQRLVRLAAGEHLGPSPAPKS